MSMSVDHCWTTPYLCTNGDVDLLQRHSYSPISDWWHRFILKCGTSSICHAYSTVSITSKEFTKFQIVLRTWNPSVKLEIYCAFIRSPINCICNIDFLWSKFPVAILYSLSSKVKLFTGSECLTNSFNVQCLFYPAFLLLASPSSICFEPLSFLLLFCCFSW